eukprot:6201445-Pleurochrysis_carterae.AAC.1
MALGGATVVVCSDVVVLVQPEIRCVLGAAKHRHGLVVRAVVLDEGLVVERRRPKHCAPRFGLHGEAEVEAGATRNKGTKRLRRQS